MPIQPSSRVTPATPRHPDITRRRLWAFAWDASLAGKLYAERQPVTLAIYRAPGRIPRAEAVRQTFTPIQVVIDLTPSSSPAKRVADRHLATAGFRHRLRVDRASAMIDTLKLTL